MELIQNLTLAGSMAIALGVGIWKLLRASPSLHPSTVAAGAVLAYIPLVFGGELLTVALLPPLSPLPDVGMFLLALLPAALVAAGCAVLLRSPSSRRWAALLPLILAGLVATMLAWIFGLASFVGIVVLAVVVVILGLAAQRARRAGRVPVTWVLVPLVAMALPSAFLELALGLEEPQQAVHAWSVDATPEGGAPYVLTIPFIVPPQTTYRDGVLAPVVTPSYDESLRLARDNAALARLRAALHVERGDAALQFDAAGDHLTIRATGPVRVATRVSFYGTPMDREKFFNLPDGNVTLDASGPSSAQVRWEMRMSGGAGHSCGSYGIALARVEAGRTARLNGTEMSDDGLSFSIACP